MEEVLKKLQTFSVRYQKREADHLEVKLIPILRRKRTRSIEIEIMLSH
jgi:hypothetical protein